MDDELEPLGLMPGQTVEEFTNFGVGGSVSVECGKQPVRLSGSSFFYSWDFHTLLSYTFR